MPAPSRATLRGFVRTNTRLVPVPDAPEIRLHLADDAMLVTGRAAALLRLADPTLPYWAFAWSGGLALTRYLIEHPDEVAGRDVVDIGTGSGLLAIVAMRAGAASVLAADIDPLAEAAVGLNAHANDVEVGYTARDLLADPPPDVDVILAGDVSYEETMAIEIMAWLRVAAANGTRILIGDPGRRYLPPDLERLATYRIHTTREIEEAEVKDSAVYTIRPG